MIDDGFDSFRTVIFIFLSRRLCNGFLFQEICIVRTPGKNVLFDSTHVFLTFLSGQSCVMCNAG